MSITKRLVEIVAISVPVIGLLSLLLGGMISLVLVEAVLIALLLSDYLLSGKRQIPTLERTGDGKMAIGEYEKVAFSIHNASLESIEAELIDEVPDYHFKVENPLMMVKLAPNEKATIGYTLLPLKRGAFEFGKVHFRMKSKLGLYYTYYKLDLEREYKVYPNMKALKKYNLASYKNILEKEGRKALHMMNRGTAFESLREYVVGDEYRKINWQASARANKPIVNQYEPEKNQRIYTFIDTGRPMSYRLKDETMLDKAINTALVLSDMVVRNGDLSGMLCFNAKMQGYISPGKGNQHRDKVMETLYHLDSTKLTSNYEDAFLYLKKEEKRSSIIFLFTDFDTLEEAEIIQKAASVVAREHILVVVLMKNEKIEKIAHQKAKDEDEVYNKAVGLDLLAERKKAIRLLNRKNVMCIEVPPEKLEMTVIRKYIEVKNRLGA